MPSRLRSLLSLGLTTWPPPTSRSPPYSGNGDRVTGLFDGYNNNQVYVDVSATDERKIPVGDKAALPDFVGGAQGLPETERLQRVLGRPRAGLKSRGRVKGGLCPSKERTAIQRCCSARALGEERRVRLEVGRLYLGRYLGARRPTRRRPPRRRSPPRGRPAG